MRTLRPAATLLEICVVLAMTGTLLAITALAIPQRERTSAEMRQVGAVIRASKVLAMRDGRVRTLSVTDGTLAWELAVHPNGGVVTNAALPHDSTLVHVLWALNAPYLQ